jgi:excinuclease UvrABC nuclease subunit
MMLSSKKIMDLTKDNELNIFIPKQSKLFDIDEYSKIATMIRGIYCFYNKEKELIYIGKSVNCIRGRIITHTSPSTSRYFKRGELELFLDKKSETKYFSFCLIEEKEFIGAIEKILILKIQPKFNIEKDYHIKTKKETYYKISIDDKKNEIWKPVNNYDGIYEVSNMGRIKDLIKKTTHIGSLNNDYLFFKFKKNNDYEVKKIDKIVAEVFIPNPENHTKIKHIGKKTDNRSIKLEWCK